MAVTVQNGDVQKEGAMFAKTARAFRIVAIAEALSWTALLIGMIFKHIVGLGDGGVPVVGMIHGVVFLAYVAASIVAARVLGWERRTIVWALVASIPPLATWAFESWALRTGKFDGPEVERNAGMGLAAEVPAAG